MSETRPLLSSSPRQSIDEFSSHWENGKDSAFVTVTGSFHTHANGGHRTPNVVVNDNGNGTWKPFVRETSSPDDISPKTNGHAKKRLAPCPESMWNDQDRRVWISANNPEKLCEHGEHRTLVLCFDGTGDQFDEDNSNIVQLLAMLRKDDNKRQLVYYQAGLGTYTDPVLKTPILSQVSMTLDQMVAWNLASHVKDGYAFLMQNYTRGDKICIFGFSRGAYTARALAGMLQKVGLLPVCNHQQLPFAYEMYKREDKEGLDMSHAFKKTYSRSVAVDFLGVWDTVASVGLFPRYLPFIHENTGIRHLRHALALDERRVKFIPSFCGGPEKDKPEEEQHSTFPQTPRKPHREESLWKAYEDLVNSKNGQKTDVEEVWFAGVHCDVGGGATPNWVEDKLSRIPLRWMIRECFKCNTGILLDARMLQKIGLPVYRDTDGRPKLAPLYKWSPAPAPLELTKIAVKRDWVQVLLAALWYPFAFIGRMLFSRTPKEPKPPTAEDDPMEYDLEGVSEDYEYQHDLRDSMCDANDQFTKKLLWIILDWIPQRVKKQKAIIDKLENGDSYKWLWNRGQGRKITKHEIKEGLKVHRSVKMRLEQLGEAYTPQARPNIRIAKLDAKGNKVKEPRRMTHYQWNTPTPDKWTWVGESED